MQECSKEMDYVDELSKSRGLSWFNQPNYGFPISPAIHLATPMSFQATPSRFASALLKLSDGRAVLTPN